MAENFDGEEELEEEYLDLEEPSATDSRPENNQNRHKLVSSIDKVSMLKGGKGYSIPKGLTQNRGPQNQARSNANNRRNAQEAENSELSSANGQEIKSNNSQKNNIDNAKEKLVSKGLSAAAQASGVPAPVADALANKVAGPLLEAQKKKKKMIMMLSIGVVVGFLFLILLIISAVSGGEGGSSAGSSSKNNYLYGTGTKEELYEYLVAQGYCESTTSCAGTPAATFYETLKSEISSNSNLTELEADVFITEFIFYNRTKEEKFAALEEIGYIAKIIGGDGKFDIYNADKFQEQFIADDGYLNTYRQDLLATDNTPEARLSLYNKILKNAQSKSDSQEKGKGSSSEKSYGYNVNGKIVSNVKVRLLQCSDGNVGEPIEGEELIDFEKYILGVVYAENGIGPVEALKAQAIASRAYALLRGDSMDNQYNLGLTKQNDEWILSIRNCTEDQVYCDPDKGCWSNSDTAGGTVHSGYDSSKAYSMQPLAANSTIRTAVADTAYKVLVSSSGKMINTIYTNSEQTVWNDRANEGKDHFEILKETYPSSSKILFVGPSIYGDYTTWKQCNQPWSSIKLGISSNNICDVGCYITSIAIQMAASKTPINYNEFNPGVLVEHLSANNAFSKGGSLLEFKWGSLAPSFKYYTTAELVGTKSQKAATIKSYQDQGYYVIIRAKSHQHWVALDKVIGSDVYMFDPATNAIKLWEKYPDNDVTLITVFKNEA